MPKGAREELGVGEDGQMPVDNEEESKVANEEEDDIDPAKAAEQAKIKAERKMNAKLFDGGRYHIIPSFFRLLMYMKKQKREFAITFNTFGEDLDNTVYEFNKFCSGEHPCFNGSGARSSPRAPRSRIHPCKPKHAGLARPGHGYSH